MILHCTQKMAGKLPDVSPTPLAEASPMGSWHAHLCTIDRRQCVFFCHDASRYVLFLPGLRKEHFADLGGQFFREMFLATLEMLGCTPAQVARAGLALGPMRFDKAVDRSVQGSMRVARWDAEAWVYDTPNVMTVHPLLLSGKLNERPATVHGKLVWPDRAMREAVERL